MTDTNMTDEQFKAELSPEYLEWSASDSCDISGPVEEIQRLAEVIVGLRARISELEGARAQLDVQLAGCGVAALGWSKGENATKQGDYGWSASYQDVVDLRTKWEAQTADLATARQNSRDMIAAADRAQGMGVARAPCCRIDGQPCAEHDGMVHGKESEELRAGIGEILRKPFSDVDLVRLLDRVDARDSLAYLESRDRGDAAAHPSGEGTGR